ncbi:MULTISPECIES: hypothetical protein [unclassified Moorena]|uniref:hypothetical protein n=1 Tax=unclassified Moorena TaxID=2683338 RepID=UPI0013C797DE|nr:MULTISPECIES: hypothetical protein [unclassified Moorena]NEO22838.1 hypothetical protein [Moorena sp. SIO4A5]NEP25749.1 hypothetical protein [Moorena sp. SIO3I6]NEQ61496.1 hypothetical protein [Moorena sp. SIO4A1]
MSHGLWEWGIGRWGDGVMGRWGDGEYGVIVANPDSRFPIPDSLFPIPDSRFPIPDSRFPLLYQKRDIKPKDYH